LLRFTIGQLNVNEETAIEQKLDEGRPRPSMVGNGVAIESGSRKEGEAFASC
jgi:hypothetical protein